MALSSSLITKWSQRGDPIHAWYSYEMIRESLTAAKLDGMSYAIYPQGSYANKTNIVGDSDVDIVIALKSAFYPNKDELKESDLIEYQKYYEQADIAWHAFRGAVVEVLQSNYQVDEGDKCVKVKSNLIRLPADVLIALEYRHYKNFPSFMGQVFIDGVQFYSLEGGKIVNFPKRHIRACRAKNNRTGRRYRRVVRVAKNARNALIADGDTQVKTGTVPSYFLESLLWNVPDSCYGGDLEYAYSRAMDWLYQNIGELEALSFPSGMGKIFDRMADTSWNVSAAQGIISALYLQSR